MTDFKGIKLGQVYRARIGKRYSQLRIKTRGIANTNLRTVKVGETIPDTYYSLVLLDIEAGVAGVQCQVTGEKTEIKVGSTL